MFLQVCNALTNLHTLSIQHCKVGEGSLGDMYSFSIHMSHKVYGVRPRMVVGGVCFMKCSYPEEWVQGLTRA